YIRAGYFMENLLPQAQVIQNMGFVGGPLRADLPLPLIATRDIGAFAAKTLSDLDFKGKTTRELLGPRDMTYKQIATVIGPAIGKPGLDYKELPGAALKPFLLQMGMSASMVDAMLEMCDALNDGYMKPLETRLSRNTTPTTLETFLSDTFLPAYRGKAASG